MKSSTDWDTFRYWMESLPIPMPIHVVLRSEYEASCCDWIQKEVCERSSFSEALLWLRFGLIDRAHSIVQESQGGWGAYIHGMVHRLEGDYWNAKYWFRRIDHNIVKKNVSLKIVGSVPDSKHACFDPSDFTDQIQRLHQSQADSTLRSCLEEIALQEWQAVWEASAR